MREKSVDRWVAENVPMVMVPKPVFIAVRKALKIAVYGFVKYPLPYGKEQISYEKLV
jgi:hypothetical protein